MKPPRGFTLLELLCVIPLMLAIGDIVVSMLPVMFRDVPANGRAVQSQQQIDAAMRQLQQDMDEATDLLNATAEMEADATIFLIKTPRGVVCYELAKGVLRRRVLASTAGAVPAKTWPVPDAVIEWDQWGPLQQGGPPLALEVRTAIRMKLSGRTFDRLANSHLFYVGSLGGRRVQK